MNFDQYISHPADTAAEEPVLLTDHLRAVASLMRAEVPDDATTVDGTPLTLLCEIIGGTHDIAKATTWAQKHLRGDSIHGEDSYRYHGFPSALVTLYCANSHDDVSDRDATICALVVARHHKRSAPPDPEEAVDKYARNKPNVDSRYSRVQDQLDDIALHPGAKSVAEKLLDEVTPPETEHTWTELQSWAQTDHVKRQLAQGLQPAERDEHYYRDLTRLWSTLKLADQFAATRGNDLAPPATLFEPETPLEWPGLEADRTEADSAAPSITKDSLDKSIRDLPDEEGIKGTLNERRTEARKQAVDNVDALLAADSAVGLITLPTGFGKTYAGLAAGLRASAKKDSRLVYVLPYTSILDQTADEIEKVFGITPTHHEFSLHHHLSTTLTNLGYNYTDADIGRSLGELHAESWRSQLTLTTTVQLFESLSSPTGRQATKLPALQDAVIVIDEPQAIPERWWKIVVSQLQILVGEFDATVILMTATQPRLVEYGTSQLNTETLVGSDGSYVGFLDANPRVQYKIDDSVAKDTAALEYTEAADHLVPVGEPLRDTLAICNTRASARELYLCVDQRATRNYNTPVGIGEILHSYVESEGELPTVDELRYAVLDRASGREDEYTTPILAYLSGNIRPDDRQLIIDALYTEDTDTDPLLDSNHPILTISTSVVEAGVDISFERVYRDIAPIPNIVQSGGRCNRSFGGDLGEVVVWELGPPPERNQLPSKVIHGWTDDETDNLPLLHATRAALLDEGSGLISEGEMVDSVVEKYYRHINTQYDPGSAKLADCISNCDIDTLADERMIREIEGYEDIIVCSTKEERSAAGLNGQERVMPKLLQQSGTHLSAEPPVSAEVIANGNSEYYIIDGQSPDYHPVFGLDIER